MTRPISKEVPPISVATTLRWPLAGASAATPVSPAVGPESSVPRAICAATETGTTPPLDCMTSKGTRRPSAASRSPIEVR